MWISKWWNQSWANIHWIERLGSLSNRSINWWKCWNRHLKYLFKFWLWRCWFIQNILFLIIFFDRLTFIRLFKHFPIRAFFWTIWNDSWKIICWEVLCTCQVHWAAMDQHSFVWWWSGILNLIRLLLQLEHSILIRLVAQYLI